MIILPAIGTYTDIDVYASILAYADLLNQRGKPAQTFFRATPNYSVPENLRIPENENHKLNLAPSDKVIILDVSNPDAILNFVPENQILEIIDHHVGYEDFWREKIGDRFVYEKIGAVATSIFEWWGNCWDYAKMSPQIARLLLAAILDNTLNFNAEITTTRDHVAAEKLAQIANTTVTDFSEKYFSDVSATIIADLKNSLLNDIKLPQNSDLHFAQLTIWDIASLRNRSNEIAEAMNQASDNWLVNIICISERKNYLHASSVTTAEYFTNLLNLQTAGDWLVSDKLWLRKEIIAKMLAEQDHASKKEL